MDPITTAVLGILPAVASDMVRYGVKDAYDNPPKVGRHGPDQQGNPSTRR